MYDSRTRNRIRLRAVSPVGSRAAWLAVAVCLLVASVLLVAACAGEAPVAEPRDTGGALDVVGDADTGDRGETGEDGGNDSGNDAQSDTGAADSGREDASEPDRPFDGVCRGTAAPHRVFERFWEVLDQRYAVFPDRLPDGDWFALGRQHCDGLRADASDAQLFNRLLSLARELDDTHITLTADGREGDAWVSVYPFYGALGAIEDNAEENYLEGNLRSAAGGAVSWGAISRGPARIGYLSLSRFDDLSPGGGENADRQVASRALATALESLAATQALIVDIRNNEGGWDSVGLDVARRFAGERSLAWTKQRRNGPEHTDFGLAEETWVGAALPNAYARPVVLLMSGGTVSAAETFALAMRRREDVTLMGEPSSGHFSDLTGGRLPNGWRFTYSGERYRAADGEVYEGRGVPVDIAVEPRYPAIASAGVDATLERAIDYALERIRER